MNALFEPIKRYEIRLLQIKGTGRLFVIAAATGQDAAEYAEVLLSRHSDCESAEIWCGMDLIQRL